VDQYIQKFLINETIIIISIHQLTYKTEIEDSQIYLQSLINLGSSKIQTLRTRTSLNFEYNESRRSFNDFNEVLYSFNLPNQNQIKSAQFLTNTSLAYEI
jgi:hypothetical protein